MLNFSSAHLLNASAYNKVEIEETFKADKRDPIDVSMDGAESASVKLSYIVPKWEVVMQACIDSLTKIWPN